HDMEFVRGPLNPSTNYEVGLLIDGFENFPALMMPWNFPYYLKLVEANGYEKEKDLLSMRLNKKDPLSPKIQRLAARVRRKTQVTIKPFSKKTYWDDIRLLADIYHDAWSDNWGFVPMSENEIRQMGKNLKRAMEPDMIFFIFYEGEPAGVGMVLPDFNPLLKEFNGRITLSGAFKYLLRRRYIRGGRALMGGIRKKFRNLGLPVIIFDYLDQLLRRDERIDYLEMGWNLEDNDAINKFELAMGAHIRSRYRIFRKNLI
ncbi:MAG: acyl-CoA N-acyltransferase, partial [Syntrophaceae bacterium]|nr:acyl-CoA N-acyltransferase [Syntrophaceae bacterium]